MINIFGKLYTLLRRPQPEAPAEASSKDEAKEVSPEAVEMKQTGQADPMTTSSEWEHVQEPTEKGAGSKSEDTVDPDMVEIPDPGAKPVGNETLDMNELSKLVDEMNSAETANKCETEQKDSGARTAETAVDKEDKDGTKNAGHEQANEPANDATVANVNHEQDKPVKETKASSKSPVDKAGAKQGRKVCQYFRRGQKCWKGRNCPFEHVRKGNSHQDNTAAGDAKPIKEGDFPQYGDFVAEMTAHSHLVNPKDLLYKLGYQKDMNTELMGQVVGAQYKVATTKNNWHWVKDARYFAELFFSKDWIDENMPPHGQAKQKKPRHKKHNANAGKQSECAKDECRDFRIKENPNIKIYTANAAGDGELLASDNKSEDTAAVQINGQAGDGPVSAADTAVNGDKTEGFISDYTEHVLQQAMKKAIGDGLSESLIMEVIDDVTAADTPRKRGKVAKVDLSRTPQKRPEQLALGFNFHSDKLVKESPKTVDGGIICLDVLPPPRETVEQLAFGFNFHAEQLVKDSPVSENGEILVPGIPTTPKRKARDQLALGFNYHSELLAKNTPDSKKEKVPVDNVIDSKVNGHHVDDNQNENDTCMTSPSKTAKRSSNDMFAVGFSYNSDQLMKQTLDKVNGNLSDTTAVSSIIEDASVSENRNVVEINTDEEPLVTMVTKTPAGSLW